MKQPKLFRAKFAIICKICTQQIHLPVASSWVGFVVRRLHWIRLTSPLVSFFLTRGSKSDLRMRIICRQLSPTPFLFVKLTRAKALLQQHCRWWTKRRWVSEESDSGNVSAPTYGSKPNAGFLCAYLFSYCGPLTDCLQTCSNVCSSQINTYRPIITNVHVLNSSHSHRRLARLAVPPVPQPVLLPQVLLHQPQHRREHGRVSLML